MSLLQLQDIQLAYGDLPLLDHANLIIEKGERLCLVGRNGTGKSTLLKVIAGEAIPEDGKIERGTTRISRLKQEVPKGTHGTIYDVTAEGVGEIGTLIAEYHHLIVQMATDHSDTLLNKMAAVQQKIENANGWSIQQQIETTLSKMGLEPEEEVSSLSGGMKRRVLL
ncbi:MAG TPA: ATP-binding cassette domain-containing protein, partial [Gammaproteobacteria bacterium]|nr:ATP-binding cassette domain-containing protein [Gammaproteobacteria bacterium]